MTKNRIVNDGIRCIGEQAEYVRTHRVSRNNKPTLTYRLLHYYQSNYLNSILKESAHFDCNLVSFELHDDGSSEKIQNEVDKMAAQHLHIKSVFHKKNHGLIEMLEVCLNSSNTDYTYIGAADDASCPAAMQNALAHPRHAINNTLIVSDFYVIHMPSKTSVYVEAILPREWMTEDRVTPEEFRNPGKYEKIYLATHACLGPTQALREAGGFPSQMKWHCDWFCFHVAALRTGIQYTPVPLACWRQSPSSYSQSTSRSSEERKVLRQILSTLKDAKYDDVRGSILSPNMTPMLDDIACQLLLSILSRPQYWSFLRLGHLRNALYEIAASWISPEHWGGKVLAWLDKTPFDAVRQLFLCLLLRLGGAQIGRKVRFGKKTKIYESRGLTIGNNVKIGNGASIRAMHPLDIGSGTRVGNNVRLESANSSSDRSVRFFRKKSVVIGQNVVIGDECIIGPGAHISAHEEVSPHTRIENVENKPLFFLDSTDQIQVDHQVLSDWYGLDPKGIPLQPGHAGTNKVKLKNGVFQVNPD